MKLLSNIVVLFVSSTFLSCNPAAEGFGAPSGSTVEIKGPASVQGGQDSYVLVTVSVKVPFQDALVPGNNIFASVNCLRCTLFDRAAGQNATLPDSTKVVEVSNPYSFSTNSNGSYQVVVKLDDPANLGVTTYEAKVLADIGVANAEFIINVVAPVIL